MFKLQKIVFLLVFTLLAFSVYAEFSKLPNQEPTLLQKGEAKHWCPICGMNLKSYYKTNHAVKLKNGDYKQYCSIRCLTFDYESIKNNLDKVLVVDVASDKFIDAEKAYYVVGSKVPGTMSAVSKLAFEKKEDAEKFAKEYGGEIKRYDETFKIAMESLNDDIVVFANKKKTTMYPVGEKIYNTVCKTIDLGKYKKINELKAAIVNEKLCGELDEKKAQAVALYLWEVKRFEHNSEEHIHPSKDEKCPVCGMYVYKYPNWAAEIKTKNGRFLFDGVKDMMKFYFNPQNYKKGITKNDFTKILVTDYYTLKSIDGKKAYYVIGSRVLGPMGKELIPFVSENDAKNFMLDYGGDRILKFEEITPDIIKKLD